MIAAECLILFDCGIAKLEVDEFHHAMLFQSREEKALMTISLGCHDATLPQSDVKALFEKMRTVAGNPDEACLIDDAGGRVYPRPLDASRPFTVAAVQEALSRTGFFPGGRVDGICGYRTRAAIRLFQEYVRSIEGRVCAPDGKFGPGTAAELTRWLNGGLKANWSSQLDHWQQNTLGGVNSDYSDWLAFLEKVKTHRLASPGKLLEKVAAFDSKSDTHQVADWSFDDRKVHLFGVRHHEGAEQHAFDDVLILLIKGLVFAFQGSTEPGSTSNEAGAPFLVPGQHDYRFGLHQGSYHALRPRENGVLVLRSKGDFALTESDLEGTLESNTTINIHWGGRGVTRNVNNWSAGCQVIAGAGYLNHTGEVVLRHDVATNNTSLKKSGGRLTRGAYDVLSDLVIALSSDMQNPGGVSYTLLYEEDLALEPAMAERMAKYRAAAASRFGDAS